MAFTLEPGLKQSQKLVMTQALRQAIELLQLSSIELSQKISSELLENPVLEEDDKSLSSTQQDDHQLLSRLNQNLSGEETLFDKREEKNSLYSDFSDSGYYRQADDDKRRNYFESIVTYEESLADHLLWQARLIADNDVEYNIYEVIITLLDEDGFIKDCCEDLARENNFNVSDVERAYENIQMFDPVGCCVKDIRQSLLVQAAHFHPDDTILLKIIEDYFVELEKMEFKKIAKNLSIPIKEVLEKRNLCHNLDPYPGIQYSCEKPRYIVPDIEVKLVDGEIVIAINDEWIPVIRINPYYKNIIRKKNIEKKLKNYIQDKMHSAKYLIKNIENRRDTIINVVTEIMSYQKNFLLHGPGHLRPLTHVDIAKEIGVHESTVSRVTSNKFVQTGWGVFELKYFFVSKIKSDKGDTQSSDMIMNEIKKIIMDEISEKPYSDEEILNIMEKKGFSVARRTIAKYRGILGIPSSNKRKKINFIKKEEKT